MHRWRNLESSDPQRYEMIRKIQSLQKRIISRNQEIVEKGETIMKVGVSILVSSSGRLLSADSLSFGTILLYAELLIQEKEKVYVELKNILARQPGAEVAEQVSPLNSQQQTF